MHTKKYNPAETHIVYKDPVFEPDESDLEKEWTKEKGTYEKITQSVDTLPENGTYTTMHDITLEPDHIYFFEDNTQAPPHKVLFIYKHSDGEEFYFDAATAIHDEICEDDEGPYEIISVEKILD